MAYRGRYQKVKSGGAGKKIIITILCVVLVFGSVAAAGMWYLDSKLDKLQQAQYEEKDTSDMDLSALIGNLDETESSAPEETEETEPETTEEITEATEPDWGESGKVINILMIGQDSRPGEDSRLADGIMLLTLNKETRTLTMTSFLRDSYVKLANYRTHTCGWNRINTSYALGYLWGGDAGAMEMLNDTLLGNYGVQVDGDVEISFDTFIKVVDSIGGLDVELLGDEYATMSHWRDLFNETYEWYQTGQYIEELVEGVNTLNGDMALTYARERHMNEADNDMNRAKRQQILLAELIRRCTKMSPTELDKLIDLVVGEILTNISPDDMRMYIRELLPYIFNLNLVSHQCPAEGTYWGEMVTLPDGEAGVLKINFEQNKRLMAEIMSGG